MDSASPELSVLIPTLRRRDDLREALRSVLDNGFDGTMEVVVCDDDPAGNAREVVAAIGDDRVRHVQNPGPHGKAANWAYLGRQARGEVCLKLDDDDRLRPGFLSATVGVLREHPEVGSVYTAYEQVDLPSGERQAVIDDAFFHQRPVVPGPEYARAVLTNEGGYPVNHKTTAVYRRKLAERFGHYDSVCEDFAYSVALAVEADVAYVPEVLYEYRLHGDNSVDDMAELSRNSFAALEALETLATIPAAGRIGADQWREWLRRCRRALPLYFLLASLRRHGAARARRLYRGLKAGGRLPQPGVAWTLVHAGGLLPRGLLQAGFSAYQRAPWMQALGRKFLGRGAG